MAPILERDRTCFGMPCKGGTEVDDFERAGTLSRAIVVRGVCIPAGSTFRTDHDTGNLQLKLSEPARAHGHLVPGGSSLEFLPCPPPISAVVSLLFLPFYPIVLLLSIVGFFYQRVWVTFSHASNLGGLAVAAGDTVELSRTGSVRLLRGRRENGSR